MFVCLILEECCKNYILVISRLSETQRDLLWLKWITFLVAVDWGSLPRKESTVDFLMQQFGPINCNKQDDPRKNKIKQNRKSVFVWVFISLLVRLSGGCSNHETLELPVITVNVSEQLISAFKHTNCRSLATSCLWRLRKRNWYI